MLIDLFEAARIGRLLELVSAGAPGHGPVHLLVESASSLGFFAGILMGFCWEQAWIASVAYASWSLISIFMIPILSALRDVTATDLCRRQGFRGGPLLDFRGSMQLLDSSHVRDRDKALLRAILSGGVWNGFSLGHYAKRKRFLVAFVVGPDGDGHLFWDCFLPSSRCY